MEKIVNIEEMAKHLPGFLGDEHVAIIHRLHRQELEEDPLYLDGVVAMLVLRGHASGKVEGEEVNIQAGEVFVCRPRNLVEHTMVSVDFEVCGLFMSPKYAERIVSEINLSWSLRTVAASHKAFPATPEQSEQLFELLTTLEHQYKENSGSFREPIRHLLVIAVFFMLMEICVPQAEEEKAQMSSSSAESIFNRFTSLLREYSEATDRVGSVSMRSVTEYADALNITPKYFSSICKQLTGKTASAIISDEVIRCARRLLRDNRYSIKEIAARLGFSNQSHFGSFFRRQTGQSPNQFRLELG